MSELSPKASAEIAQEAYFAQDEFTIEGLLARPEFSRKNGASKPLKATVGSRLINTKDGFGVCVRGAGEYQNDLFMIFRGTTFSNYGADVISDLRFGVQRSKTGHSVHIGFNHVFCSMLPDIREFLRSQATATGTIHCVGHSLGGAVAAIAADWLSSQGKRVKLYTFGAPKPGLENFSDTLTKKLGTSNIYRVYHSTDVVPMVPVYPFTHSPTNHRSYQIDKAGLASFAAHKMRTYSDSIKKSSWQQLQSMGEANTYDSLIEQWLKSDSPANPADPRTWDRLNAGLVWLLRRTIGATAVLAQAPIMTSLSLADKIAWTLRKSIDLAAQASIWVLRLMRKIMQALGMRVAKTANELTQQFMRSILGRLIERMSSEARRAVNALMVKR